MGPKDHPELLIISGMTGSRKSVRSLEDGSINMRKKLNRLATYW